MIEITQQNQVESWFDYEGGEGESYQIKFTPPEEIRSKSEFEIFDTMLLDWKGVLKNGLPLECTTENKYALFLYDVQNNQAARYWWIYRKACTMFSFVDLKKTLTALNTPSSGGLVTPGQAPNGATSARPNASL